MNYLLDAIWIWKAARPKIREEWGLGALTDEQLADSLGRMLQGLTYKKESALLKKEFGVVIAPSSLHSFYKDVSPFVLMARRRSAVQTGDLIGEEMRQSPRDLTPQIIDLIQQSAVELLADPVAATTSGSVKTIVRAFLKIRDQDLVGRRIDLLEKQATEAKETVENSKLSDAQKADRLREIFKRE